MKTTLYITLSNSCEINQCYHRGGRDSHGLVYYQSETFMDGFVNWSCVSVTLQAIVFFTISALLSL